MARKQVVVPDIGGADGAQVIEMLVAVGDEVSVEQSLLVLESDKASMEIPSSEAGTVVELIATVGAELSEGDAIAVLEVEGAGQAPARQEQTGQAQTAETVAATPPEAQAEAPPAQVSAAEPGALEIARVPDIGTDEAVDLIEVCVAPGDSVAEGDSLVVLESDKASMEVPAPFAGVVERVLVEEGGAVREGDELVELQVQAASSAGATADRTEPAPEPAAPVPQSSTADTAPAAAPVAAAGEAKEAPNHKLPATAVHAGPAVRKLSREFGVALAAVKGSGPRGRVLKEDLHEHVRSALSGGGVAPSGGAGIPPIPAVKFEDFGEVSYQALTRIDKVTAANMQRSWLNVPHVTQFDSADITEMEAFRADLKGEGEKRGVKLTPMPFLLKACAVALRDNPKLNASLSADGENLVYKHYIHIGMAVDTPAGLMVPVIRDVERKSMWELAEEVVELAAKARDRKLSPNDMRGGCFTISSLGGIGGTGFTPIVNAPEVGILGVSKASIEPVWDGAAFAPRKMLPLALSYDHRVINGGDAGRFCTQLVALLGDIRRLLL